ncbi:MAG: PKD domain-containing protein [Bacteroidales bacterium]
MKKNIIKITMAAFLASLLLITACEPQMEDKPEIPAPPTADQLDFTITEGSDAFHVVITNTSSVTGIAHWNLGNGSKARGQSVETKYSIEGDYTIKLTLVTKGGTASTSKTYTQTETDFSIFTDPVYVNLSGGVDAADGVTWVMDSTQVGHLGVGPADDPTARQWWSAAPLAKSGTGLYDDEITFKLNDFIVEYDNKGVSYVKDYRANDPALSSIYLNPVLNDVDYDVEYATPVTGNWSITEKDGQKYLVLIGDTPIFPCFDVGAKDNEYKIVQVTENLLELTAIDAYGGINWHYFLIPKGYERPTITFDLSIVEGSDNEVSLSLTNYSIPVGESVSNITWDFGDGSEMYTTATKDEVVNHTYMRAGSYTVTAKVSTSLGEITETGVISLENNNSAYVPFQLDVLVLYNDFSEVQTFPVVGEECSVTIVDNPHKIYPNKSAKVAYYEKTDKEWANAYMKLEPGYRFDLRQQHVFSIKVYGNAGDQILLKLENTDKGVNAWQTGTYDLIYTIQETNEWEVAEYDFSGVGAGFDWTGDIYTTDVVADDNFNHDFYNVVRIMCNPGVGSGTHSFYFDDLVGPHVEGVTKK